MMPSKDKLTVWEKAPALGLQEITWEEMQALCALALRPAGDEGWRVEMKRYLPILDRLAGEHPALWDELCKGTGVATLNGYKRALEAALHTAPATKEGA